MSATRDLTRFYGNFFIGAAHFAVSPYTCTFFAGGATGDRNEPFDLLAATLAVGFLTFAVPILPAIFAVTSAIAAVALSLAVASMFLSYPAALLCDAALAPSSAFAF